jgi:hypothetical protein
LANVRRHVTVYSGVLASNSKWRRFAIPKPVETAASARELGRGSDADCEGDAEAQDAFVIPGSAGQLLVSHHQQAKPKTQVPSKSSSGHYIPWSELMRPEATIREILTPMHLPQSTTILPKDDISQPSEPEAIELDWGDGGRGEANMWETVDWPEYPD